MTPEEASKPLAIEAMREEDIPQVLDIEREAFSLAWSEGAYRRELRWNRLARYLVLKEKRDIPPLRREAVEAPGEERLGTRILSFLRRSPSQLRTDDVILGYAGQWLMVDEAHLITIAVRDDYRGRGLGEALLIAAIDQAVQAGARIMTLEVRASNLTAQAMYEKFGFRKAGIRPRYYTDNNEDAVLMASDILTSAPFQVRLQGLREESKEKVGVSWSL